MGSPVKVQYTIYDSADTEVFSSEAFESSILEFDLIRPYMSQDPALLKDAPFTLKLEYE